VGWRVLFRIDGTEVGKEESGRDVELCYPGRAAGATTAGLLVSSTCAGLVDALAVVTSANSDVSLATHALQYGPVPIVDFRKYLCSIAFPPRAYIFALTPALILAPKPEYAFLRLRPESPRWTSRQSPKLERVYPADVDVRQRTDVCSRPIGSRKVQLYTEPGSDGV
jgi:hypothetical protein